MFCTQSRECYINIILICICHILEISIPISEYFVMDIKTQIGSRVTSKCDYR